MKIADLREAAMEWTVTFEGPDEFGEIQRAQVQIEKWFERLASGEIGLDRRRQEDHVGAPGVRREARARYLCSGATGLRVLRKVAASQGLHEAENSHCVWDRRSEKSALDGLPALLSPFFYGVLGSRRNLPGSGHARTHGGNGALGQHAAVSQGCGALGRILAHRTD